MKKILTILFSCLLLMTQIVLAEAPKTIRFATEATYPPFEYTDENGAIKGFDIEIADALCKQMKAQCTFANQSFSSLIPSLQLGKFDALIAAIGITAERQKQVAFTDSYYSPSASFVGNVNKHFALAKLDGKTIGVQQGSTFEKYLKDKYGNRLTMKTYASIQDAFLDLTSERIDMVLADTTIVQIWLKQNNDNKQFSIIDKPVTDPDYFGTGYGIAVRKDNTELLNSLNQALKAIKANGVYDKIIKDYLGA